MTIDTLAKIYPPVGFCIYCGKAPRALSTEHIIAYGLGGNLKLPKASCGTCADITKRFEHTCLRTMLGPLRIRMKIQTKHPKQRPSELAIQLVRGDDSTETITIPAGVYPMALVLARFHPPGILTGAAPQESHPGMLWWGFNPDEADALRKKYGVSGHKLGAFNATPFCRMLAKIGHSFAVAELGLDKFKPTLPDVILDATKTPSYWVGGSMDVPKAEPYLHTLSYHPAMEAGGRTYVVVHIRLFANLGAPQYHVVAGERP